MPAATLTLPEVSLEELVMQELVHNWDAGVWASRHNCVEESSPVSLY